MPLWGFSLSSHFTARDLLPVRQCAFSLTLPHSGDQSEVSVLGMCSWLKEMGCFTGCSKTWPSFPSLCQKEATSQRTSTAFSLLPRKGKHWNLEPSSSVGEIMEDICAFKRHLDYNCRASRTISLFCVRMTLSTSKSQPIIGACRCTVCCDRRVIIVLIASALLTFLRANTQIICYSSLSEGMVSRVVSSWKGSPKLVQEEKEMCKRRCTG